jgi:hypothetical protein
MSTPARSRHPWRDFAILALAACGLLLAFASLASAANAIQTENALAGTAGWRHTDAPYPSSAQSYAGLVTSIDGYTVEQSVAPGGTVQLHVAVATPDLRYRIQVYRLGWYGGVGARGKACLPDPNCLGDRAGVTQPGAPPPMDPVTGQVEAGWPVTDTINVGSDWVGGYYIAQLILTNGPNAGTARWVAFIVRQPSSHSTVMVQVPVTTWLAYNGWGGKSVYDNKSANGVRASHVSFARPTWAAEFHMFDYEYPFVRFMERNGYDVSYATDVDVHRAPSQLRNHKLIMVAGHDEYWSAEMRDGWDAARDAGVNVANMGANTAYWQVRFEDDEHTMVVYKSTADPIADPARKTLQFRDVGRPECELFGVQYNYSDAIDGIVRNYGVVNGALSNPWFAGTGFSANSTSRNTVGYEWDLITPGCDVPTPTPLFHWDDPADALPAADAVTYTAPSGAKVFSSGSMQFSYGLDPWRDGFTSSTDVPMYTFMQNMMAELTGGAPPPPPPNQAPAAGFSIAPGSPVVNQTATFTDTSVDYDGAVTARAWDLDGDGEYDDATGATVARAIPSAGTRTVRLRVTDDDGARATAARQFTVVAAPAPDPPAPPNPGPTTPAPKPGGETPAIPAPAPSGGATPTGTPFVPPISAATANVACVRYTTLLKANARTILRSRERVRRATTRPMRRVAERRLTRDLRARRALVTRRANLCAQASKGE